MRRLSVLWVSFEDTSPRFGCYGDRVARTPNVDRVAAEGCVYEQAFTTAPVCAPARAAIITGMYATSIGCQHMRTGHDRPLASSSPTPYEAVPPPHVKCFTEYLRATGYYCCNNDKTDYQFGNPTTAWDDCSKRAHWRNREPGQPFFAVFNPTATHESGMWEPADKPAWSGPPAPAVTDPAAVEVPPYLPDTPAVRAAIARQYDNIAANDMKLGELLKQLEEDGLLDSTAIFIWSDHGEGLPRRKRWPYDSGTRIPLIARVPGLTTPGSRSTELASLIDLAPTVLSLCGVPTPAHLHGRPFLGPDCDEPRPYAFATRDRYDESYDKMRSVRDGRYRYVRSYYPNLEREIWLPYRNRHPIMQEIWAAAAAGGLQGAQRWFDPGPRPPEELYDLQSDPHELTNLAGRPDLRPVLRRLRSALGDWQARHDPYLDVPEAEMVRRWHAVSPDGKQPATDRPLAVVLGRGLAGFEPLEGGETVPGPVLLQLTCQTEGASIEYRLGDAARWKLYAGPLRLPPGETALHARAIRYGYKPSDELRLTVNVS